MTHGPNYESWMTECAGLNVAQWSPKPIMLLTCAMHGRLLRNLSAACLASKRRSFSLLQKCLLAMVSVTLSLISWTTSVLVRRVMLPWPASLSMYALTHWYRNQHHREVCCPYFKFMCVYSDIRANHTGAVQVSQEADRQGIVCPNCADESVFCSSNVPRLLPHYGCAGFGLQSKLHLA